MPTYDFETEEWEPLNDEGNPTEEFNYIELEFLFDSDIEGTHISELIASIAAEFGTQIADTSVLWERDDPTSVTGEGGVALYDLFPNKPGLLEACKERLKDFNVDISMFPTKGF